MHSLASAGTLKPKSGSISTPRIVLTVRLNVRWPLMLPQRQTDEAILGVGFRETWSDDVAQNGSVDD